MTSNSGSSQEDVSSVNILVLNFKRKVGKSVMWFRESLSDQNWNRNEHVSSVNLDTKHLHHSVWLLKRHAHKMATNQAFQEQASNIPIVHF